MRAPTPRFYFAPGFSWTSLDADIDWVEITAYTMEARGASVRRGRSSELDDYRAGTAEFTLNNSTRRFDPTYTGSPYHSTYLNLTGAVTSYASTPDHVSLDITGDIDVRAKIALTDWTTGAYQYFLSRWTGTNDLGWIFCVNPTGGLELIWTTSGAVGTAAGAASTANPSVSDGSALWVRATLDVNNGAGQKVTTFYTSADDTNDHTAVSWTQLGSAITSAGTTSIAAVNSILAFGAVPGAGVAGRGYAAAVLNGIGGTVAANPTFVLGLGAGATSLTDGTGKTWTVSSPASIAADAATYLKPGVPVKIEAVANSTTFPVFRGFIDGWPQDYDRSNKLAYVDVRCTDGFAKLATAGTPSSVYAIEVAADTPKIWWRLSESIGPTVADSSGNDYDGALAAGEVIRAGDHPNPYESIKAFNANGGMTVTTSDATARILDDPYTLEGVISVGDLDANQRDILRQSDVDAGVFWSVGILGGFSGSTYRWLIRSHMVGEVTDVQWNTANIELATLQAEPFWHVVVRRNAGVHTLYLNGVAQALTSAGSDLNLNKSYSVAGAGGANGWIGPIGDLAVYDYDLGTTGIADHFTALTAPWDGDTTGGRTTRILGFGWPADLLDIATGFTTLGPASLGQNQLALIKGYEKAEQGRFFIARDGTATFLDRYYNQLVAEGATSQATFSDDGSNNPYVSIAFDYDDRLVYNRVRGSRTGGGVIEVADQDSINTYGEQVDSSLSGIQVGTDALVRGVAELRLDRYKEPQLRVRPIELKLHGLSAVEQPDVLGLELGYRVTVERTPQGIGSAISQETVVEGISHRLSGGQWSSTLTLSPVDTREYGLWGDNWGSALWGY